MRFILYIAFIFPMDHWSLHDQDGKSLIQIIQIMLLVYRIAMSQYRRLVLTNIVFLR